MFNIIQALQNNFTRESLPDNLSSEVALHFNVNYWRAFLEVSCLEEMLLRASALPLWLSAPRMTGATSGGLKLQCFTIASFSSFFYCATVKHTHGLAIDVCPSVRLSVYQMRVL